MNRPNIAGLRETASKTPNGEAFQILHQRPGIRVGAGVTGSKGTPFLEITVIILEEGKIDVDRLEEQVRLLRILTDAGYRIEGEGASGVTCELVTSDKQIIKEVERLDALIK